MNKNWSLALLCLIMIGISACKTDDDVRTIEEDQSDLEAYLVKEGITETPTTSGLYYIERTEGDGFAADSGEFLIIEYNYSKITGEVVAPGAEAWLNMDNSSENLQGLFEGVKYMREGGEATMVIPSELAFGSAGADGIEPNMSLIFNLKLIESRGESEEKVRLLNYVADSSINVQPELSGIYYIETLSGEGADLEIGDDLRITYAGKFLNGTVFDQGTISYRYGESTLIKGFIEAIGLMKRGGKSTVIIPYQKAYGVEGYLSIAPYSTLIFDLELLDY